MRGTGLADYLHPMTTASDTTRFFDLDPTDDPNKWTLDVSMGISVGPPKHKFLFGGVGLASSITAMERTTGRPTIWATAPPARGTSGSASTGSCGRSTPACRSRAPAR